MSYKSYECSVLNCTNTSVNTQPRKLFIKVPTNRQRRKIWLDLAKRNPEKVTSRSKLYICEDHFDIKNDMINYMEYTIMGSVKKIHMKAGCVPTKFDCKTDGVQKIRQPCSADTTVVSYEHENIEDWRRSSHKPEIVNKQPKIKIKLKKVTHGIYEHDRSEDVEVKIEPCNFEESLNLNCIKEEDIINKAVENSYKESEVREDLDIGPKMFEEEKRKGLNKNKHKDVENKTTDISRNNHVIKEEVLFESDATQDEENVFDLDNNVIKQELVVESEITSNHADIVNRILKIEVVEEVNVAEGYNESIDVQVKKEPGDLKDVNLYIKNEKEVNLDKNNFLYSDNDQIMENQVENLYKDHKVKDELVIGPEHIQEVSVSPKSHAKDIKNCFSVKKNINTGKCKYVCDFCQKSFNSRKSVRVHLCTHDQMKLSCHVCGKKFTFEINLKRHLTIHTGEKPFQCHICDSTFARKDYLKFHIHSYHSGIKMRQNIRPRSTCDLCNKEFSSKCSRDHHKKHSCPMNVNKEKLCKNKLYICDICDKTYIYRSSLTAHITKYHGNKSLKIVPLHQCDYCGKKYVKKHNLQCHMQWKHLNVSPYKCVICKETFTWYSTLATHERRMHRRTSFG